MITTIVIKGSDYSDVRSTYEYFKDETYVMREFSQGFLLIFNERSTAHKCMNRARKKMLNAKYSIQYKRYNHLIYNSCKAEINL
jgi:hypothetical protein